ncbi:fumarylacetoacetase [Roseomonas sp. CCTCC AB2023176]|uniref:fumarylacetoacetase n=1 Tax=Roseomonas sp. CCTCC AB2023176 TaxID=3342640 RepID=UPI0035D929F0
MTTTDATHDPGLTSWVASANGHAEFPIQNLPLGVFSVSGGSPRAGVAIGDDILDLTEALRLGLLAGEAARAVEATADGTLNGLMGLGAGPRRALRAQLSHLLAEGTQPRPHLLHRSSDVTLHLPARIGDYTDFYVGIHHATNVGKIFRPDNPLLPNYKYVPIGYHGRASSVRLSGTPVTRPNGQRKRAEDPTPSYGPCRNLDYELEMGIWIGPGNDLGTPIRIGDAPNHVAGYCLLNDWSARDVQGWEYQPLGPFLAKNFLTTVSPWVVTPEALAPFRIAQAPRAEGDPAPLPYLSDGADQATGAFDLELEITILTPKMREAGLPPHRLSLSNMRHMYWTAAQIVTHHACNGCDLHPGDLLGTGTLSAPDPTGLGSLLETSRGGKEPVRLPSGEERRFLEDGDEVALHARGRREGFATIGFGPCLGTVRPAPGI